MQPFLPAAVLIGASSIPLVLGWVPMNRFYGVRTRKTLSNPHVWFLANRFGGALLLLSSVVYGVYAAISPMRGSHDPRMGLWLAHLLMFIGPVLLSTILTAFYVRRL